MTTDRSSDGASHGEQWAASFGASDARRRHALRARYLRLRQELVFRMDAASMEDPLTASTSALPGSRGGDRNDSDIALDLQQDAGAEDGREEEDGISPSQAGWSQYYSDDHLLQEINTDLNRLYPAGNESFFQNDKFLGILRQVLFVWCKLHPDVSYRQGMHDVAAVVFFSFLTHLPQSSQSASEGSDDLFDELGSPRRDGATSKALPANIEEDIFIVFEALMLFLKPLYEIVKTTFHENRINSSNGEGEADKRLFSSFPVEDSNDPANLFGAPLTVEIAAAATATTATKHRPPLHRLCYHIQYELLGAKDPQLYYHLQNLEIVPETYCLRWIRLLFAREHTLGALVHIWDGMILDEQRPAIQYPDVDKIASAHFAPTLAVPLDADAIPLGFPLLPYLCVAKLLRISSELRRNDNTGCLRLLMQAFHPEEVGDATENEEGAIELTRFAQVLRDPMLAQEDGPQGVDVVEFGEGPLGIVLTSAGPPFANRLAVKDFVGNPSDSDAKGKAEATGRVSIGDLLDAINGAPIIDVSAEEVKRHIQLVPRPLFLAFRHIGQSDESTTASESEPASLITLQNGDATSEDVYLPRLLPGEKLYAHVETSMQRFALTYDGSCLSHFISGKLFITNYRCIFTRLLSHGEIDWQVPVLSIASIDGVNPLQRSASLTATQAQGMLGFTSEETVAATIRCKDTQIARLSFANSGEYAKLFKCLRYLAFPTSMLDAFCFSYAPTIPPSEDVPFDIRREYKRLGLLDCPGELRCIDQSPRYDLCETYPQHLIVPTNMTDVMIQTAAAFRCHNRLPVVCWRHQKNGAILARSAQPLVGIKSNRCEEDELLVRLLCCAGSETTSFGRYVIMDARSQLAAVGNKAMGKGTEIASNYSGSKLVFLNIENIHAIRQSCSSLVTLFEPRRGTNDDSTASYYGKLDSSGWLRHVRAVLKASMELAHLLRNGTSVLTHCSDGWDRTSQMVSLAELMLDPYYRTLRGFQCLVEKEWCSFGHHFAARCGHARSDVTSDQRSPVFLLWLDCVWQFLRQFPSECEFNENLLLALADHIYSCKYGTFMFDCEHQRKEFFSKHRVASIWSDVNSNSDKFTNPQFAPLSDLPMLSPSTLSKNIKLWKGYFARYDPTVIPPVPKLQFY